MLVVLKQTTAQPWCMRRLLLSNDFFRIWSFFLPRIAACKCVRNRCQFKFWERTDARRVWTKHTFALSFYPMTARQSTNGNKTITRMYGLTERAVFGFHKHFNEQSSGVTQKLLCGIIFVINRILLGPFKDVFAYHKWLRSGVSAQVWIVWLRNHQHLRM